MTDTTAANDPVDNTNSSVVPATTSPEGEEEEKTAPPPNKDSSSLDDDILYSEEYKPVWLPTLILVPFLLPLFWHYHVRVTSEVVSFGYSHKTVEKTVNRSDIQTVEQVQIRGLQDWGGWGLRGNLKGHIGYISKNGPGIKLIIVEDGKEKVYVFNCDDSQRVYDILKPTK